MGCCLTIIMFFIFQTMPQPTPDPQPVLIVSDGEQGDKLIKIKPPAEPPVPTEKPAEQNDPGDDPAPDNTVSTGQND